MPRIARVVWPMLPYHATQRGNRRGRVFFNDRDRSRYLDLLLETTRRAKARIWAYVLMNNHVHLVVVPERADSLALGIGHAHGRHARIVNKRQGWSGHLWESRFYSAPLDETHLWAAVRYVELNPVRAGLVRRAEKYRWSSARAHALGEHDPLPDPQRPFPGHIRDWGSWLHECLEDPLADEIRVHTRTGRPAGSKDFVIELEGRLRRRLRPGKRGPKAATRAR